ncbi:MAG: glycogen phosphorylase [Clostridia bacterium]|jgi:starch phosphorylase|nr:alpha-glucan phosphorylase [Clostridiales bacterium]MDK2984851.1 glycogen phosphorylase [Clostridia bacterium]
MEKLPKVAYFCMEYGLHKELPIYSGGLGVLAGDLLKTAKENNAPVIGIGILWHQDYTEQYIGENGRPYDVYPNLSYDSMKDTGVTVNLRVRGEDVTCKVYLVDKYDNAPLYLLDTNFPGGKHGWMTDRLYGGEAQDRIASEMILGIGGVRALRAMGIEVDKYHFNEGHAVFAGLELIREKMQNEGLSFHDAWKAIKNDVVFTTHTPVEAGNESHDHGTLQHMEAYNGLTYAQMCEIGGDPFNMTVAALRMSHKANAVSKLHGETAREMWKDVDNAAPIIAITNGVHNKTWQNPEIREAYENNTDLWEPHMKLKKKLLEYVKKETGVALKLDNLVIGFARRAAAYKRTGLIFRNPELIDSILKEGKMQLVFSGKAHPKDEIGKDIIQHVVSMAQRYKNNVVFLENYDMGIAELLVQGCDVWLNNPRRPLEASGTSGMKAAMNGVLNVSVLDGWVAEGVEHGINGWLLDERVDLKSFDDMHQDEQDIKALYEVLLEEVIPTYYEDRKKWLEMMQASITMSRKQYSSTRMLKQYYQHLYSDENIQVQPYMIEERAAETDLDARKQ